jgi:glucose uptake protein
MYQPQSYAIALSFMLISMLCWGSWANTVKLCPGYKFQLFYWDYVGGLLLGSIALGLTMGTFGAQGPSFVTDVLNTDARHIALAFAGGIIFNIANLLLVAAIDVAGLAVAFPVGIGLALAVGAVGNYIVSPAGNPWMLFVGVALVLAAIVFDAMAYRMREKQRATTRRGVIISLSAGVLMGVFYPFVAQSMTGIHAPGPYAVSLFFAAGVIVCSLPVNYLMMRKPLDGGAPVSLSGFKVVPIAWHFWGMLGGAIWCAGAVLNFVASRAHVVGPAVSYSIGQGATMISACWGVFVWREFAGAPAISKKLLVWMFLFFLAGLGSIALAPVF